MVRQVLAFGFHVFHAKPDRDRRASLAAALTYPFGGRQRRRRNDSDSPAASGFCRLQPARPSCWRRSAFWPLRIFSPRRDATAVAGNEETHITAW